MAEAKNLSDADRCSLFVINQKGDLVSKVFDGAATCNEFSMSSKDGIVGHVFSTGKLLNVRDAYKCEYFDSTMDKRTGYRTK